MSETTAEGRSDRKALDASWLDWIALNLSRGCDVQGMRDILLEHGFDAEEVNLRLDEGKAPAPAERPSSLSTHEAASVAGKRALPVARGVDSPDIELFEIPDFLDESECMRLIALVRDDLRRSTTTGVDDGVSDYRTSRTCDLGLVDDPLVRELDRRICACLGLSPEEAEPIQGQWYEPGDEFKPHTDYFEPDSSEFEEHARERGQRTWTFMIYLNSTRAGGETDFPVVGARFGPRAGTAVVWNNLIDSRPNAATLHHGMPVRAGYKAIITKWFRARSGTDPDHREKNEFLPPLTKSGFLRATMPAYLHEQLHGFLRQRRHLAEAEHLPDFIVGASDALPSELVELSGDLRDEVHRVLQPIIESWIGDRLVPTYVFGIRNYRRGSSLAMHRDRIGTHVASAILNIEQSVDGDWPLVIEDHVYRRHEVVLRPGEMVLYEGARLLHGRPFPFVGTGYANVFAHFRLDDVESSGPEAR